MVTRLFRLLIVVASCITTDSSGANEYNAMAKAKASIIADDLQSHVNVLADDSFEGREAGSRGGRAAAGYLAKALSDRGLAGGAHGGSYYQPFGAGYRNVLGILEGTDETLKHEYVLLGAHFDHVGYGNHTNSNGPVGYVHNGADDNASGVAGLLEIIDAVRLLPQGLRRSLLVAFWDGEEKGLLGSWHWVRQPTVSLPQVKFTINMDMIGRLQKNRVEVHGARTMAGMRQALALANQTSALEMDFHWQMKDNSDHFPFFSRNIPVLMVHTGLHNDYHTPRDDAHMLDSEGMAKVSKMLFDFAVDIANREAAPRFRARSQRESEATRQSFERPLPKIRPRFGISWRANGDSSESDSPESSRRAVVVTQVARGGPADRSGISVGDRILAIGGVPTSIDLIASQVLQSKSPVEVQLIRKETEEPEELQVQLDGNPVRLGISWRESDAEPGALTIARVIPGSPAQRAGIRLLDRIYKLNGKAFQNGSEFQQLANATELPCSLLVDRKGRRWTSTKTQTMLEVHRCHAVRHACSRRVKTRATKSNTLMAWDLLAHIEYRLHRPIRLDYVVACGRGG